MIETRVRRPTAAPDAGSAPKARRLPPQLRKLALATHVLVAVGWFGVVVGKLILEITAATTRDPDIPRTAYLFMEAFDRALFPPAALATLLTGIVLSVGTAWGLFQHYWIVTKLVLTVAIIVTGVVFVGAWTRQAVDTPSGSASIPLIYASLAHLCMLGAATVISIYKPWGRIRPARRDATRQPARRATNGRSGEGSGPHGEV